MTRRQFVARMERQRNAGSAVPPRNAAPDYAARHPGYADGGCAKHQRRSAAASAASFSMRAKSPRAIASFGATQEPPTATTFGSAR